jgi:hypothetical protein
MDYDRFRRDALDDLFCNLPMGERAIIEELARSHVPTLTTHTGPLLNSLLKREVHRVTAERHPDLVPTLDGWLANRHGPRADHLA